VRCAETPDSGGMPAHVGATVCFGRRKRRTIRPARRSGWSAPMELADLVALSLVPTPRSRLVEAADLSTRTDRTLDTALDCLGAAPEPGPLRDAAAKALARAARRGLQPLPRDDARYPG